MKKLLSIGLIFAVIFTFATSSFAESELNYYNELKKKAEFVKNSKPDIMKKFKAMENSQLQNSLSVDTNNSDNSIKMPSKLEVLHTEEFEVDGVQFVRTFYRKKSSSSNKRKSASVSLYGRYYEEGDFATLIAKGDPSGKDFFDELEGYTTYLQLEAAYKLFHWGMYLVSDTFWNIVGNEALALIEKGHKGKGLAYSIERRVHKWGQIYHNNKWVDYYQGHQDEVYWCQKVIVTNTDHNNGNYGDELYAKDFNYTESEGYNPIFVNATKNFRYDDKVFELANAQYKSGGYIYGDTGSDTESTSYWLKGVEKGYVEK